VCTADTACIFVDSLPFVIHSIRLNTSECNFEVTSLISIGPLSIVVDVFGCRHVAVHGS